MILKTKGKFLVIILSIFLIGTGINILLHASHTSSAKQIRNQPPTVSIIKSEEKSFYLHDIRLFPSLRTHIFGFLTIKANAADDAGIKQVEFYIDGELRNISTSVHHCGSHMWIWNERILLKS